MLIHPGCHLGDAWFYVEGDTVHAYYLVCPDNVPRHTAWDIAHATSTDLIEWDFHGLVLRRGDDTDWDGVCLATGSVIRHNDRYLMAYTARWNELEVATGLATSDDLHHWTKAPDNPTTRPPPYVVDRPWSDRPPTHWRDPFLIEIDGGVHQLVSAARADQPDDASGTVGHAMLDDNSRWKLCEPLQVEAVARELECPTVNQIDGRWFLTFSSFRELFSAQIQKDPSTDLGHGTYAMIGDGPLGPFRFVQRHCILPADHPDQLYAGQIVTLHETAYLIGTVWRDDAHDYLNDAIPLRRDGECLVTA